MGLFSQIAMLRDIPEEDLARGQIGTIVEVLSPTACIAEFLDEQGDTVAIRTLRTDDFMLLHHPAVVKVA